MVVIKFRPEGLLARGVQRHLVEVVVGVPSKIVSNYVVLRLSI